MKIVVKTERIEDIKTDAIAIGLFEKEGVEKYKGLDKAASSMISNLIKKASLTERLMKCYFLSLRQI